MTPFLLALSHISGSSVMTYSPFSPPPDLPGDASIHDLHLFSFVEDISLLQTFYLIPFLPWALLPESFGHSPEHLLSAVQFLTAFFAQDQAHHKSSFIVSLQQDCVISSSP